MSTTFRLLGLTIICVLALFVWANWTDWRMAVDLDWVNNQLDRETHEQIERQRAESEARIAADQATADRTLRDFQEHVAKLRREYEAEIEGRIETLEDQHDR